MLRAGARIVLLCSLGTGCFKGPASNSGESVAVAVDGGLLGDGSAATPLRVDPSQVQARVLGACAGGSAVAQINADGTAVCAQFQSRVTGTCPPGNAFAAINADGTAICVQFQSRVTGGCPSGSAIASINADGSISCATIPQPQKLVVAAGGGLAGDGSPAGPLAVDLTKVQARVSGSCAAGSAMLAINADGSTVCAPNPGMSVCPQGYVRDPSVSAFTLCSKTLAGGQVDQMVQVGDSWIDRYEAFLCGGNVGGQPGQDTTGIACSIAGQVPVTGITQLQALAVCANAGKHLCRNDEWQTAASGTPKPSSPSDGSGGVCVTAAPGPRATGGGTSCRSRFGAEDMIGNVSEWVADWQQTGFAAQTVNQQQQNPWPGAFGTDGTWNINGRAWDGSSWKDGLPAAPIRGGAYSDGTSAGVFEVVLSEGASSWFATVGARCCTSH